MTREEWGSAGWHLSKAAEMMGAVKGGFLDLLGYKTELGLSHHLSVLGEPTPRTRMLRKPVETLHVA